MKGVDVNTFDFNFDLTFAALLMHADGTIHHTYAGRDSIDPESHLALPTFVDVLKKTLPEHAAYSQHPRPPKRAAPESVDQMPWMKRRKKQPDCYHCHNVHDARLGELRYRGRYTLREAWSWPDPVQVGLTLDKEHQTLIKAVAQGSPAAKAGLEKGDHLVRLAGAGVLTFGDVQRVLHNAASDATSIDVTFQRGGKERNTRLGLAKGWRKPTPLVFAWRATKWPMEPQPGFGGQQLTEAQKKEEGVNPKDFAFEIRYLVTWGDNAHTGRNAARAGLRKKDIVLSIAGKKDFASMDHYHAWFRLTRTPGTTVPVKILRDGKRRTIQLPVLKPRQRK
jgi:serine protease Do